MNSAPRWWKQMSSFVLLVCFKIGTSAFDGPLSLLWPPWWNSVGYYIIFDVARTDNTAADFCSKMVETDVFARLIGLLQNVNKHVRRSSVIAITTLVRFGGFLYLFWLRGLKCSRWFPLQDGGNRCLHPPFWLASRLGPGRSRGTTVIYWSHHCLGEIR